MQKHPCKLFMFIDRENNNTLIFFDTLANMHSYAEHTHQKISGFILKEITDDRPGILYKVAPGVFVELLLNTEEIEKCISGK